MFSPLPSADTSGSNVGIGATGPALSKHHQQQQQQQQQQKRIPPRNVWPQSSSQVTFLPACTTDDSGGISASSATKQPAVTGVAISLVDKSYTGGDTTDVRLFTSPAPTVVTAVTNDSPADIKGTGDSVDDELPTHTRSATLTITANQTTGAAQNVTAPTSAAVAASTDTSAIKSSSNSNAVILGTNNRAVLESTLLEYFSLVCKLAVGAVMPTPFKLSISPPFVYVERVSALGVLSRTMKSLLFAGHSQASYHLLHEPLKNAITIYLRRTTAPIFELAKSALMKMQDTYKNSNTSLALQPMIDMLSEALSNPLSTEPYTTIPSSQPFSDMWLSHEVNAVAAMFNALFEVTQHQSNRTEKDANTWIQAIESLVDAKVEATRV